MLNSEFMNFQTHSQGIWAVNVCFCAFVAARYKVWATIPSYYRGKGPFNQNIENKCSHIFPLLQIPSSLSSIHLSSFISTPLFYSFLLLPLPHISRFPLYSSVNMEECYLPRRGNSIGHSEAGRNATPHLFWGGGCTEGGRS